MIDLSTVIPIRNTSLYLSDCLDSIISQGLKNYEIILVDDGSTDNSLDICKKYAEAYPFVMILEAGGNGVSHAKNIGQNVASGTYLYFMDSDDTLEPNSFKDVASFVIDKQPDLYIFSSYRVKNNNKESFGIYDQAEYNNGKDAFVKLRNENNYYCLIYNLIISRKLLVEHNITWKEDIIQEDHLYIFFLFMFAQKTISQKKRIYNYFVRENSIMNSDVSEKRFNGCATCALDIINFYEKGISNKELSKSVITYIRYLTHLASMQYLWSNNDVDKTVYDAFENKISTLKYINLRDYFVFRNKNLIRYLNKLKKSSGR